MNLILIFTVTILGSAMGSFFGCQDYRLRNPKDKSTRSHCLKCKKTLKTTELIPIISYILQRGKCKSCQASLRPSYLYYELGTALGFFLITIHHLQLSTSLPHYISTLVLASFWIFIIGFDIHYKLISDYVAIPLILVALTISLSTNPQNLFSILTAMAIGYAFFYLQILMSKGKWVGLGDTRLGLVIGTLGLQGLFVGLFSAYIIGAIITMPFIFKKNVQIPFAPFLAIGFFLSYYWAQPLLNWYLNFYGF